MRHTPFWVAVGIALLLSVATAVVDAGIASGVEFAGVLTWLRFVAAASILQMVVSVPLAIGLAIVFRILPAPPSAKLEICALAIASAAVPVGLHAVRWLQDALPQGVGPTSPLGLAATAGLALAGVAGVAAVVLAIERSPLGPALGAQARRAAMVGLALAATCGLLVGVDADASDLAPIEGRGSNVLLISVDSVRADVFEEFVQNHASETTRRFVAGGRAYRRGYTTYSHSLPSHASMLTGLYPPEHGAVIYHSSVGNGGSVGSAVEPEIESVPERLRMAGYETIGIMSNAWLGPPYGLEAGFDSYFSQGRALRLSRFDGSMAGSVSIVGFYKWWLEKRILQTTHPNTKLFLDWLGARDASRPFFAFLHYIEMHVPHDPAPRFRRGLDSGPFADVGGRELRARVESGEIAPEQMPEVRARLRQLNLAMLKEVETFFAPVLDAILDDPRLADTLVLFVSDHGDNLYEKDDVYTHTHVYDTATRVPFVLRAPGLPAGWVDDLVSVVDFAPTVYAFLGLDSVERLSGIDLASKRRGPDGWIYVQGVDDRNKGWARAVLFGDGVKYIREEDDDEALFDTVRDAGETRNLAGTDAAWVARYRDRFDDAVDAMPKANVDPIGIDLLPEETREQLRGLGYIE